MKPVIFHPVPAVDRHPQALLLPNEVHVLESGVVAVYVDYDDERFNSLEEAAGALEMSGVELLGESFDEEVVLALSAGGATDEEVVRDCLAALGGDEGARDRVAWAVVTAKLSVR